MNWIKCEGKDGCEAPPAPGHLDRFGILISNRLMKPPQGEWRMNGIKDDDCVICLNRLFSYCNDENVNTTHKDECDNNLEFIKRNLFKDFVYKLKSCKHVLHIGCAKSILDNNDSDEYLECPICKTINGTRTGTQPCGNMAIRNELSKLPGFEIDSVGTIIVTYSFSDGIQGPKHPNPGQTYSAATFPRATYFPNNEKGQTAVSLLKIAFDRRLVFTVGRSITTGRENVITWNGIHHKTSTHSHSHGYPDPNYLETVLAELKAFGVTEKDLPKQPSSTLYLKDN